MVCVTTVRLSLLIDSFNQLSGAHADCVLEGEGDRVYHHNGMWHIEVEIHEDLQTTVCILIRTS